jgi:hypothetical protein
MATLAIGIDVPPIGELETSGDGSSPTDAPMDEDMRVPGEELQDRARCDPLLWRRGQSGIRCF